jgi:hypothetical protein
MRPHIDSSAVEAHTLGFQPQALFDGGIAGQLDRSACA